MNGQSLGIVSGDDRGGLYEQSGRGYIDWTCIYLTSPLVSVRSYFYIRL